MDGRQVLTWGGGQVDLRCAGVPAHADGAAYDPITRDWTPLPPSPLSARTEPQAHWTGHQVIALGGYQRSFVPGSDVGCQGGPVTDGAAYTPAEGEGDGTWRSLPPAPLPEGASIITSVWTSDELLAWAGRDGAVAFDPATWTWRTLPPAPEPPGLPGPQDDPGADVPQPQVQVSADSVWTGDRWLVWASVLDSDYGSTPWPVAYDPVAGTWSAISSPPAESWGRYWDGDQVLTLTYASGGTEGSASAGSAAAAVAGPTVSVAAYDETADTWAPGPVAPEAVVRAHRGATFVVGGRLLTWQLALAVTGSCDDGGGGGGDAGSCAQDLTPVNYAYDPHAPRDARWAALRTGPWEQLTTAAAVDTGSGLVVVGGRAGLRDGGSRRAGGAALPTWSLALPRT